jgi:hypothetical protein
VTISALAIRHRELAAPISRSDALLDPAAAWIAVPGLLTVALILLVYAAVSARQAEISYGE